MKMEKKPKKLPKYLSEEEIRTLLDTPYKTNKHHILMMKLAYKCGLRNSEVCHITVKDIKFDERKVHVFQGKGAKDRLVPMPYDLMEDLKKYIDMYKLEYNDRLFDITERGFGKMIERYGKRAGLDKKISPHMLRHSFAVHRLKAGASLRSVQKALGHTSLTTTQIYLDITDEDVQEDFDKHPLPV